MSKSFTSLVITPLAFVPLALTPLVPFKAQAESPVSPVYSAIIDQPLGEDIGWAPEVFVRDINQDGNADVLLSMSPEAVYYLGNGDGTLTNGTWFTPGYNGFSSKLLEDFNNDGYPDYYADTFFAGGGDLSYANKTVVSTDLESCGMLISAKVNNDNLMDIVCAADDNLENRDNSTYGILVFENDGNFNFRRTGTHTTANSASLQSEISAMASGDIDNDGNTDIVQAVLQYSQSGSGSAWKTEHHTIATYRAADNYQPGYAFNTNTLHNVNDPWEHSNVLGMQLADTNNDGNLDAVVIAGSRWVLGTNGYIAVYEGNGNGTFEQQPVVTPLDSELVSDFKLADMDSDGNLDIVISYSHNNNLSTQLGTRLRYGLGNSTFGEIGNLVTSQDTVRGVDVGDISGDSRPDIVTAAGWNVGSRLQIYSQNEPVTPVNPQPVCQYTASDPDGDGWGWENAASCIVTEDSSPEKPTDILIPRNRAYALCSDESVDPDNDGWGWENNQTCQVASRVDDTSPEVTPRPVCEKPWRDFDGDGWGYENGQSCIVVR